MWDKHSAVAVWGKLEDCAGRQSIPGRVLYARVGPRLQNVPVSGPALMSVAVRLAIAREKRCGVLVAEAAMYG